jgi:hypothetical protein
MPWNYFDDPMLDFTTTNLDAYFPQLQLYHGKNKKVDLNILLLNATEFISSRETNSFSFKLNVSVEAMMHEDNGTFTKVGTLEWLNGRANISIYSEGMLFNGTVNALEFNDTYSSTGYYERYRQANFTINIALYGV